jgi:hypothetical protein
MPRPLKLDPNRLLPADPAMRAIARALYDEVAGLPIVSPHGHTDPAWFATDAAWTDPTELLLAPDHYLYRMLYSQGVPLEALGVPSRAGPSTADPREAWRALRQPLLSVPRDAVAAVARPCLRRAVRLDRARGGDRGPYFDRLDRGARHPRLPSPRPVRALQHRAARDHRGTARGPRPPRRDPPVRLARPGRHHLPPRCGDRSRA